MASRLLPERVVPLGGMRSMMVSRTLPHRELPTIGAWCFLDHFGPDRTPMQVLPHPHTGLQTVTWPFAGSIRHRDSLGSDVVVRSGELNLMTSGHGVSHSEVSLEESQLLHGLQLWVALPDVERDGLAGFEHRSNLPIVDEPGLSATVLVGTFMSASSPAVVYTPLLSADIHLTGNDVTIPLNPEFEHGLLLVAGDVSVDDVALTGGPLLYLAPGRSSLRVSPRGRAHLFLVGGAPFDEELVMWWNFVGRSHEDIVAARVQWEMSDPRFGTVAGHDNERIPAPDLPNVHLRPRRRG